MMPPNTTSTKYHLCLQVKAYVDEVLQMLELSRMANALVGVPGVMGLAPEARKRMTIGVELVSNPSVVFMDEPTSGLDSHASMIVMRAVVKVAASGRTVFVTVHQPAIETFEAFDNLLLLQRGGRIIYFGPLGHRSSQLVRYRILYVFTYIGLRNTYRPSNKYAMFRCIVRPIICIIYCFIQIIRPIALI
jgi:ABC-type multidrug transport system ATPase subunit